VITLLLLLSVLINLLIYFTVLFSGDSNLSEASILNDLKALTGSDLVVTKNTVISLTLAEAIWYGILAFGFWQLRRWAWIWVMISQGYTLTLDCWKYFQGQPEYLPMSISVIIVLYLNQREVQRVFRRANQTGKQESR
jgi:uncharacterized membrane protein (DUF2068 family)